MCGRSSAAMPGPVSEISMCACVAARAAGDGDAVACLAELDRIAEQILEQLHEARAIGVGGHHVRAGFVDQRQALVARRCLVRGDGFAQHVVDDRGLGVDAQFAGAQVGHVHQVADHAIHELDIALDALVLFAHLLRGELVFRIEQHRGGGVHHRQRRAQVMRDDGEHVFARAQPRPAPASAGAARKKRRPSAAGFPD